MVKSPLQYRPRYRGSFVSDVMLEDRSSLMESCHGQRYMTVIFSKIWKIEHSTFDPCIDDEWRHMGIRRNIGRRALLQ